MNKVTPGKWEAVEIGSNGSMDNPVLCYSVEADGREVVAEFMTEADARLIAAAPDLLQALQILHDDIADYIKINNLGALDNHAMKLARAAIARATGANHAD